MSEKKTGKSMWGRLASTLGSTLGVSKKKDKDKNTSGSASNPLESMWVCDACTLENDLSAQTCVACNTVNPNNDAMSKNVNTTSTDNQDREEYWRGMKKEKQNEYIQAQEMERRLDTSLNHIARSSTSTAGGAARGRGKGNGGRNSSRSDGYSHSNTSSRIMHKAAADWDPMTDGSPDDTNISSSSESGDSDESSDSASHKEDKEKKSASVSTSVRVSQSSVIASAFPASAFTFSTSPVAFEQNEQEPKQEAEAEASTFLPTFNLAPSIAVEAVVDTGMGIASDVLHDEGESKANHSFSSNGFMKRANVDVDIEEHFGGGAFDFSLSKEPKGGEGWGEEAHSFTTSSFSAANSGGEEVGDDMFASFEASSSVSVPVPMPVPVPVPVPVPATPLSAATSSRNSTSTSNHQSIVSPRGPGATRKSTIMLSQAQVLESPNSSSASASGIGGEAPVQRLGEKEKTRKSTGIGKGMGTAKPVEFFPKNNINLASTSNSSSATVFSVSTSASIPIFTPVPKQRPPAAHTQTLAYTHTSNKDRDSDGDQDRSEQDQQDQAENQHAKYQHGPGRSSSISSVHSESHGTGTGAHGRGPSSTPASKLDTPYMADRDGGGDGDRNTGRKPVGRQHISSNSRNSSPAAAIGGGVYGGGGGGWGGHDVGGRINAILDMASKASPVPAAASASTLIESSTNLPPPSTTTTTTGIVTTGPTLREVHTLLFLNNQLNETLQQQEDMRVQESQDYLYSLNESRLAMENMLSERQELIKEIQMLRAELELQSEAMKTTMGTGTGTSTSMIQTPPSKSMFSANANANVNTDISVHLEGKEEGEGEDTSSVAYAAEKFEVSSQLSNSDDDDNESKKNTVFMDFRIIHQNLIDNTHISPVKFSMKKEDITAISQELKMLKARLIENDHKYATEIAKEKDISARHLLSYEGAVADKLELSKLVQAAEEAAATSKKTMELAERKRTKVEEEKNSISLSMEKLLQAIDLNNNTINTLEENKMELNTKLQKQQLEVDSMNHMKEKLCAARERVTLAETTLTSTQAIMRRLERENHDLVEQLADLAAESSSRLKSIHDIQESFQNEKDEWSVERANMIAEQLRRVLTAEQQIREPLEANIASLSTRLNEAEKQAHVSQCQVSEMEVVLHKAYKEAEEAQSDLSLGTRRWEAELTKNRKKIDAQSIELQASQREVRLLQENTAASALEEELAKADALAVRTEFNAVNSKLTARSLEIQNLSRQLADARTAANRNENQLLEAKEDLQHAQSALSRETGALHELLEKSRVQVVTMKTESRSHLETLRAVQASNSLLEAQVLHLSEKERIQEDEISFSKQEFNKMRESFESERAIMLNRNQEVAVNASRISANALEETTLKLTNTLHELNLQTQRATIAEDQLHSVKLDMCKLQEKFNVYVVQTEHANARVTRAQLESDEIAARVVAAEEQIETLQSKLAASERENEQVLVHMETLRSKVIQYEERLRLSIPAAEATASLQRERVELNLLITSWQDRHTNATESLHTLRQQEIECCIELRKGMQILGLMKGVEGKGSLSISKSTSDIPLRSLIAQLCQMAINMRDKCTQAVDSCTLPCFSDILHESDIGNGNENHARSLGSVAVGESTVESTHRLMAEARLMHSTASYKKKHEREREREHEYNRYFNQSDGEEQNITATAASTTTAPPAGTAINITAASTSVSLPLSDKANVYAHETPLLSFDSLEIMLDALIENIQIIRKYDIERHERLLISTEERIMSYTQQIQELKQRLSQQDRSHRENLETLAASEIVKMEANKRAIGIEAAKLTSELRESAEKAIEEHKITQDKLQDALNTQQVLTEATHSQQKEIDMLRADIVCAVEKHNQVQVRLQHSENSYAEALLNLERSQLKSSQEARKRHDLERTVRRINLGGYSTSA